MPQNPRICLLMFLTPFLIFEDSERKITMSKHTTAFLIW